MKMVFGRKEKKKNSIANFCLYCLQAKASEGSNQKMQKAEA